ncbi:MAG TPA: CaiB/BaiF CoA-transferase family protein [Patescibacteria group bacterium]|nr:CaiB/BaiF CoA-transferase family protein [Patescibacteria group bacterium]
MFQNLLIIELASVLAGPSVGMFFAELGARVLKIENPSTKGDVTRSWKLASEPAETDISSYFSSVNWGKESVALDLENKCDYAILLKMIAQADIIIASYKPGDAEKLHVDYNTLKKINPKIIYGHITGYGAELRVGYDAIIQAEAGFTFLNGEEKATKMPVALMDVLAAHQLKEGLLVALLKKIATGEGSYVGVSLIQSGIASLVNQAANWLVGKEIPQRIGSEHPNIVPYGTIFKTSDDKEIVLAVGSDAQFSKLCGVLKIEQNERFKTNSKRVKLRSEVNELLKSACKNFTREELLKELHAKNIPAGAIHTMQEVFEMPQAKEMLVENSFLKGVRSIAFKSSIFEKEVLKRPPHFDEHGAEIRAEFDSNNKDR